MAIDEPDVIDITAINRETGETLLVICDHLPWIIEELDPLYTESDHLYMLQNKVLLYLNCVKSGELFQKVSDAVGTTPVVLIEFLHPLNRNGQNLVNHLKQYLGGLGVELRWIPSENPAPTSASLN